MTSLVTHAVVRALLASQLLSITLGWRLRSRTWQRFATDPARRIWLYRQYIGRSWTVAGVVLVTGATSAAISTADLGLAWPHGDGLDYLLAGYLLVVVLLGGWRARHRARRGDTRPGRVSPLVPRTARERRLAVGVSITAGITEELLFRGLYFAAFTRLYHLPLAVAVVASLALFVAAHTQYNRRGLIGVAVAGALYTTLYLASGSLLLGMVIHIVQDLVALVLVPAIPPPAPAPPPTPDAQPEPQPEPELEPDRAG